MKDQKSKPADAADDVSKRQVFNRRTLLKNTATAMPVILTLQSGAALARSSNMISEAPPGTRDRKGRTLCLDTGDVRSYRRSNRRSYGHSYGNSSGMVDLGDPAYAKVDAIRERNYRVAPWRHSRYISESDMCRYGRPGYYRSGRNGKWRKVQTKGMIVSATALSSFVGHLKITDL